MSSFWPKGIGNAFLLRKIDAKAYNFDPKALPMPFFWPEDIANAFMFTWNGKFSL